MTEVTDLDRFVAHERIWPIGLIISSALFAGMYGFFAYGYSDDPKSCEADSKDDIIGQLPYIDSQAAEEADGGAPPKGQVNIAYRFRLFFFIGFYLSVVQVVIGIIAILLNSASTGFKKFLVNCYYFTWFLVFWNWVWCLLVRFQESGRTCSGDYMANRRQAMHFQYVQGLFMWFAGLTAAFIYFLYGVNWIIKSCCRPKQSRSRSEMELYEVK